MSPRRVCVVVSARASYSRVRTALLAMKAHAALDLKIVLTASALLERYGGVAQAMSQDGLEVAARAATVMDGHNPTTMATSTGLALLKLVTIFENLEPDLVVTVADRYETMATATAAAYMNIPLAHVQGGEVTGSVDEKVRHAVTKLADLHLVSTPRAAQRVVAMGEDRSAVFVTGCPSIDLAVEVAQTPTAHEAELNQRMGETGYELPSDYSVVLQHPVTTECDAARDQILETLRAARDTSLPAIVFQPNEDAGSGGMARGISEFRRGEDGEFAYLDGLGPHAFLRLLHGSRCLVGNSSVGIRECSYLGVPVVNVGSRQRHRERGGNVRDAPHERATISGVMAQQVAHGPYEPSTLYGAGGAGPRIASILADAPLTIDKKLRC